MRTDQFEFDLPPDRIALRPAVPRDSARLLLVEADSRFGDRYVRDLPDILLPGDVLVLNDTRVIPARLSGVRIRENGASARIEATLHKQIDGARWRAFLRPGKRVAVGDLLRFGTETGACFLGELDATVEEKGEGGDALLAFAFHGPTLEAAIEERGAMPLPPYIAARRAPGADDRRDYQTVFARHSGSVAAPTAGLHLTQGLLDDLRARGVEHQFVTLHVGAGTFLPVKTEQIANHQMHAEWGEVSAATASALNAARGEGGRIVAVGSTSLRLLESATGPDGAVRPFEGETSIFITPGYRFRSADLLLTNFHLPRSTLFMLVCAFSGMDRMHMAYAHAIDAGYRFYSYGDACLLTRVDDVGANS